MDLRTRISVGIDFASAEILEIGPLYRPLILKSDAKVTYVDHTDAESLREKYREDPYVDLSSIVDIDAVWGKSTLLECVGGKLFDYIIASHVIEHVPDVLTWLGELRQTLKPNGQIRLVVPDRRFTFDYLRRETELPDLVDAYLRKARLPLPRCILDHVHYVRRGIDPAVAWEKGVDIHALEVCHPFELGVSSARDTLENQNYHDVHCWVFTPHSFARVMREAAEQDLLTLACDAFEDTLRGALEFTAYLTPEDDKEKVIASWRRAEQQTLLSPPNLDGLNRSHLLDVITHLETKVTDLEAELSASKTIAAGLEEQLAGKGFVQRKILNVFAKRNSAGTRR
jgi:SAM-dependent methyltransferase